MKTIKEKLIDLDSPDYQITDALNILRSVKRAVGGKGKIYAQVISVSKSGMSRTIALYIVHKGEIINLNHTLFWKIYGDSKTNKGDIRINGCGMDMLFEATYRIYHFLFNQKTRPYQEHLVRYESI